MLIMILKKKKYVEDLLQYHVNEAFKYRIDILCTDFYVVWLMNIFNINLNYLVGKVSFVLN